MSPLRLRERRCGGFALIELLVVVAIIGILCTLIIPNLIDSLRKSKQKRTMSDMHLVGTAWLSWLTDQVSASAAGLAEEPPEAQGFDWNNFDSVDAGAMNELLVPIYASFVPVVDAWGGGYEYGAGESINARSPMAIRSPGSDFVFSDGTYSEGSFPQIYYEEDIVWSSGYFVHWPAGLLTK